MTLRVDWFTIRYRTSFSGEISSDLYVKYRCSQNAMSTVGCKISDGLSESLHYAEHNEGNNQMQMKPIYPSGREGVALNTVFVINAGYGISAE